CTSRRDQVSRAIFAALREHPHAALMRLPSEHRFVEMKIRSGFPSALELRGDAALGKQDPGARLEHADHIIARLQSREACANVVGADQFVRETVLMRAAQCAGYQFALRSADHQSAGAPIEQRAALLLQLAP